MMTEVEGSRLEFEARELERKKARMEEFQRLMRQGMGNSTTFEGPEGTSWGTITPGEWVPVRGDPRYWDTGTGNTDSTTGSYTLYPQPGFLGEGKRVRSRRSVAREWLWLCRLGLHSWPGRWSEAVPVRGGEACEWGAQFMSCGRCRRLRSRRVRLPCANSNVLVP